VSAVQKKERPVTSETHKTPWNQLQDITIEPQHIEKKGKFSYVSWPWAWRYVKELYPDATYEKHLFGHIGQSEIHNTLPYMMDDAGNAFVMVTVTIDGLKMTEPFPVLNHNNKPVKNPDSFQVNTSLQRALVKAIAMHGLGHYIYAGEDLPPDLDNKHGEIENPIEVESSVEPDWNTWLNSFELQLNQCETEEQRHDQVTAAGKIRSSLPTEMQKKVQELLTAKKLELTSK
jgi:hypothetical protein